MTTDKRQRQVAESLKKASAGTEAGADSKRLSQWLICVALIALTLAIYGQSIRFDFVNFDDPDNVYENPAVTAGLTGDGVVQAFAHGSLANWDPLTILSHMVDCQVYGLRAGGHHLTNVLLHAASVGLLFLVLRLMTGALWRSALVAAVFAVHPLHVESVAWVTERKDVLSGLFFMLTLGAYWRYTVKPGSGRYLLVLLALALGLMSKSMLVTVPLILLILDWWPLNRLGEGWKKLILEKAPMLALSLGATAVAFVTQAQAQAVQTLERVPLGLRLENAVVSCGTYLWQTIWPSNMAAYYPYPEHDLPVGEVIGSAAALVLITAVVVMVRKQHPYLLAGWLWFAVMLVPVIGLVQVGDQAHADRYMYLPQVGLTVGAIWLLAGVSEMWPRLRGLRPWLALLVLGAFGVAAFNQTSYWRDSGTLWTHALSCTHGNSIAHCNLGRYFLQKKNYGRAEDEFKQALAIDPNFVKAQINLGDVWLETARLEEAKSEFRLTLKIDPASADAGNNLARALAEQGHTEEAILQYEETLRRSPEFSPAHYNLANLLLRQGKPDLAIPHYRSALHSDPSDADSHNNLASVLFQRGAADEAIVEFQSAVRLRPESAEFRVNLGSALFQKGELGRAADEFEAVLKLQPDSAPAQNILNRIAWMLATSPEAPKRNGKRAAALAQKLVQISGGNNPNRLATLAAALAETGQFPEALTAARNAQALASQQGKNPLAEEIGLQLNSYGAGRPWREAAGTNSSAGNRGR